MSKREWWNWTCSQRIGSYFSPFVALLLALFLLLTFPAISEAHAVLLRSDPARNAVLHVPPKEVRLWFSEAITPGLSTAQVVTPANQAVGQQQVSLPSGENSELVVTLGSTLPPGVYAVLWRTVSNDDGHVESGSFLFTVARPDGTLPPAPQTPVSPTGAGNLSASLLSGPTLVSFLMTTLIEIAAVCWVGAAFWIIFVLEPAAEDHAALRALHQQIQARLVQRVQPLMVLTLLLAHVGLLLGQALSLTQGNEAAALTPEFALRLVTAGSFGLFWVGRLLLLLLALRLLFLQRQIKQSGRQLHRVLAWGNLIVGLAFFIALAFSSHAAAVAPNKVTIAVLLDWGHLVAAALWVGSMLIIALGYLPVVRRASLADRATALITVLPYYSPWALAGVVLMALTGPLSATFRFTSWEQLVTTAYGWALLSKVLLVGVLLLLSATHVLLLRPQLRKATQKYRALSTRLQTASPESVSRQVTARLMKQVKQREIRLMRDLGQLVRILRMEAVVGVTVLIAVGLLNVLGGTLIPVSSAAAGSPTSVPTPARAVTLETFDQLFRVTLTMTPQQVGSNTFHVRVADPHTGKTVTSVKVQISTELPESTVGGNVIPLTADGKGQFSGSGDLTVSGTWRIIVHISTPDDPDHFHEAYTDVIIAAPPGS